MLSKTLRTLAPLRDKLFFSVEDVSLLLGVKQASGRMVCFRAVGEGLFIRLKNDMYILDEKWRYLERRDFFLLANYLQVPSYVSFMTALSFYGITTQVPQSMFESACLKRTRSFEQKGTVFNFYKLKKQVYTGFVRNNGAFIATAEKAFLDAVYLYSFGKYKIDFSALDVSKLDRRLIKQLLKAFPLKTRTIAGRLCKI